MNDLTFLNIAVEKSKESFQAGLFPAGAVVAKDGEVIAAQISSPFPDHRHADTKVIDQAFDKLLTPLSECTLYCSMEPCLMCVLRAWWAGVRRIVFAVRKEQVSHLYYESNIDNIELISKLHQQIEFNHLPGLEDAAQDIIKAWEASLHDKKAST